MPCQRTHCPNPPFFFSRPPQRQQVKYIPEFANLRVLKDPSIAAGRAFETVPLKRQMTVSQSTGQPQAKPSQALCVCVCVCIPVPQCVRASCMPPLCPSLP